MNMRSSVLGGGLGLGLAVVASIARIAPAAADPSPTSAITQLMVIESGDKNYKLFHGAIWLDADKATSNYRWGGAQCGGRDIAESTVQLLFSALRSGDQVSVEYAVGDLKGKQYRCITAVTFSKG